MSNETKALKKIASAVPILGSPFAKENKVKRFVTDISKFTFGILMMSLVKVIQNSQNQMEVSSDMQMGSSTMENSESMSMNMLSISMFLVMYAQMRSGAMVGELIANQTTRCCTQENNEAPSSWREHEIPKKLAQCFAACWLFF